MLRYGTLHLKRGAVTEVPPERIAPEIRIAPCECSNVMAVPEWGNKCEKM
jgi:hypothetical protein